MLVPPWPKRKQTKRVLTNIYYSPQSKTSISLGVPNWEVGADTKLYPNSALGNSLIVLVDASQIKKKLFSWPPMPLKIYLLPWG